jgi:hypothetical protein
MISGLTFLLTPKRKHILTSKDLPTRPENLPISRIRLRNGIKSPIQRRRPQGIKICICGRIFKKSAVAKTEKAEHQCRTYAIPILISVSA